MIILLSFRAWVLDKLGWFSGPPTLFLFAFHPFSDFKATALVLDCIKQFASRNWLFPGNIWLSNHTLELKSHPALAHQVTQNSSELWYVIPWQALSLWPVSMNDYLNTDFLVALILALSCFQSPSNKQSICTDSKQSLV